MKKVLSLCLGLGVILSLASCGGNTNNSTNSTQPSNGDSVSTVNKDSTNSDANISKFDTSKKITLYTRDTTSGTRDGFFTKIGLGSAKEDNSPLASVIEASSNGDMILKVKNDEYGIGYISLSSLEDSGVKGLIYEGVEPTEENVINETYKLTRNFNYITRNEFENTKKEQIVKAFVAYMSTKEGKATVIANSGIVELKNTDKSWNDIKSEYPVCAEDNKDITIKFGGSTSVEKIAKALSKEFAAKCGNFVPEHNHTGSGDAFKYTQGAKKDDSAKLDIGFLSRELNDTEVATEGTAGKICTDAIVTVVNEANPLTSVVATDLVKTYTGEISKWNELVK